MVLLNPELTSRFSINIYDVLFTTSKNTIYFVQLLCSCLQNICKSSLHSKRFRASSSRKLGRGKKRGITRLETLATQAIVNRALLVFCQGYSLLCKALLDQWELALDNYCIIGRDPFNQNSNLSDREKRTTSKGGPVFRLD